MTTIINGSSPSVTFSDGTTQSTAFTTGAVTQSTIATGVAGTGPAFSASASGTTSCTTGTWTKITLDIKAFDTNNNFASSRFTPTIAGYYQINAQVQMGVSTIPCAVDIYKNGTTTGYAVGGFQSGQINANACISKLLYLNGSTDYVEMYAIQISGGTLTTIAGPVTQLNGSLVRAA
jgi:hypothetical protein